MEDKKIRVKFRRGSLGLKIAVLAVVVLSRIYTGVYREKKDHQKRKEEKQNADS